MDVAVNVPCVMEGAPYLLSSQRTRLGSMAGILGRKDHTGGVVDRVTSGERQGQGVAAASERVSEERVSADGRAL